MTSRDMKRKFSFVHHHFADRGSKGREDIIDGLLADFPTPLGPGKKGNSQQSQISMTQIRKKVMVKWSVKY